MEYQISDDQDNTEQLASNCVGFRFIFAAHYCLQLMGPERDAPTDAGDKNPQTVGFLH
jgi:hypothetical protein